MPSLRLQHYNIRTTKVDESIRFYADVLGLQSGYRPVTNRPGAWMYDKTDIPVVHISGIDLSNPEAMAQLEAHLGKRDLDTLNGSGAIDHIAFEGEDYDAFRGDLDKKGVAYTARDVPEIDLKQLFLVDPNGITVELNFTVPAAR